MVEQTKNLIAKVPSTNIPIKQVSVIGTRSDLSFVIGLGTQTIKTNEPCAVVPVLSCKVDGVDLEGAKFVLSWEGCGCDEPCVFEDYTVQNATDGKAQSVTFVIPLMHQTWRNGFTLFSIKNDVFTILSTGVMFIR